MRYSTSYLRGTTYPGDPKFLQVVGQGRYALADLNKTVTMVARYRFEAIETPSPDDPNVTWPHEYRPSGQS